ncbi:hypothetical protein DEO23_11710 [Brachybacterium endophyticum]|uniref:DUF4192 domain-containing protein n=1 Tax=Brachybacterium endophyticum TaxID=2182385 RepID=A0A2U2RJ95_9MICO|nr:hypothetical protein [Brachybacterium endophyticum]PWH05854.1 hypothetical protein DEO23_11710 [Brachybacterium endophyticum]
MSTATPDRTLRADDPSELLAETYVTLGDVPRDCLVLIGHVDRLTSPLSTRVALRDLRCADDPRPVGLERHLGILRVAGCTGAFALSIAGNGLAPSDGLPTTAGVQVENARRVALGVVQAATLLEPDGFDVPEVWVLADGYAERYALEVDDRGGARLAAPHPPEVLRNPQDTLVAVQEVRAGRVMPQDESACENTLRGLGDQVRSLPAGDGPGANRGRRTSWRQHWQQLPELMHRAAGLAGGGGDQAAPDGEQMTLCEQLVVLRERLAGSGAPAALLRAVIDPDPPASPRTLEALVARIWQDGSLRPPRAICAGGEGYKAMERLRVVFEGTGELPLTGETLRAWSSVSASLGILAWWNHRFARAGEIAEEMLVRRAEDPLAPFLLQLADLPSVPPGDPRGAEAGGSRPRARFGPPGERTG